MIYFVRHAEAELNENDLKRPLTKKGLEKSREVSSFLIHQNIDKIYSSPYKRAIDTVNDLAEKLNLTIEVIDDFRERKISTSWIENFDEFALKQWENMDYKLDDGESLNEVKLRNITALKQLLKNSPHNNIVIGTHGTALSTILNYYDPTFDYHWFKKIVSWLPFIVKCQFDGNHLVDIEIFNI